jgi:hypothetical protein
LANSSQSCSILSITTKRTAFVLASWYSMLIQLFRAFINAKFCSLYSWQIKD